MKRLYILLFVIYLYQPIPKINAAEVTFIVHHKNGDKTEIDLDDIKQIKFAIPTTSIENIQKIDSIVKTFQLFHNYPNPFNPTITITYSIPKDSPVDIYIFNTTGELVRNIHYIKQSAGSHSPKWDAQDQFGSLVASGTYFYQVKFDNQIITKKMLFIKFIDRKSLKNLKLVC